MVDFGDHPRISGYPERDVTATLTYTSVRADRPLEVTVKIDDISVRSGDVVGWATDLDKGRRLRIDSGEHPVRRQVCSVKNGVKTPLGRLAHIDFPRPTRRLYATAFAGTTFVVPEDVDEDDLKQMGEEALHKGDLEVHFIEEIRDKESGDVVGDYL